VAQAREEKAEAITSGSMKLEEFEKLTNKELRQEAMKCFEDAATVDQLVGTIFLPKARFYLDEINRREETSRSRRDFLLEGIIIGLIVIEIVGSPWTFRKTPKSDQSVAASHFAKKMECQKYENEILNDWKSTASSRSYSQSLERIFYSPSLDSCVVMIYRLPNSGAADRQVEIRDVLTEKVLWYANYPMNGASYEQVVADADAEIKRNGWGEK
jgi:hypothetical protein